jgi:hypothetical protein
LSGAGALYRSGAIKLDFSRGIFVSLETDGTAQAVVGLTMRLTADRHVSVPIGKRESCFLAVLPGIAKL